MTRVVVIGNSGGGKSILARQLAAKFALPYIEIDSFLWLPGWQLVPAAKYQSEHSQLVARERWLLDGLGVRDSIPSRLVRATEVVLVDMPLWIHFWLAADRQVRWAAGQLQDPPAAISNAPPTRALFKTIWDVDREWMPEIRALVACEEKRGKRIFRVNSLEELEALERTGFDPSLLANDELYFNAARLDRSMVLKASDYAALAKPRLERIADARGTGPGPVAGS
jgi:adenylate kinase family enzyme